MAEVMSKMSIKCVCFSLLYFFRFFLFFVLFRHCSLERISLVLRRKCVIRGLGTLESQITLLDPHRVTVIWPESDKCLRITPLLTVSEGSGSVRKHFTSQLK